MTGSGSVASGWLLTWALPPDGPVGSCRWLQASKKENRPAAPIIRSPQVPGALLPTKWGMTPTKLSRRVQRSGNAFREATTHALQKIIIANSKEHQEENTAEGAFDIFVEGPVSGHTHPGDQCDL